MKLAYIALAASMLLAGTAQAVEYENDETEAVEFFGAPDSTNYGQIFSLSSKQTLVDWSFYTNEGTAGDLSFVVAAWDGAKPVGPALFQTNWSFAGGQEDLVFNNINTTLDAGQYIAYMTVAGVSQPAKAVTFAASSGNGGLTGNFAYLNSAGQDPLVINQPWSQLPKLNLLYKANIVAAPVPEPGALAMMLAGLVGVGMFARRRQA